MHDVLWQQARILLEGSGTRQPAYWAVSSAGGIGRQCIEQRLEALARGGFDLLHPLGDGFAYLRGRIFVEDGRDDGLGNSLQYGFVLFIQHPNE